MSLGDAVAQRTAHPRPPRTNWPRLARFAVFGFAVHAPLVHGFYAILDRSISFGGPRTAATVLAKVAVDQLLWSPASLALFYVCMAAMQGGQHLKRVGSTLRSKLVPTVLAGYAMWPAAHVINFAFIPPRQRVLYVNLVQVGWSVVLSRIASRPDADGEAKKDEGDCARGAPGVRSPVRIDARAVSDRV